MPEIKATVYTDEKTWQTRFYELLFGPDSEEITVGRSTDGYTRGILFEHKTNVQSYGESKALGQALIYLSRFNRDGIPVPAKICLVGQEEQKCYVYDTQKYMKYVNDIPTYANMKASDGIPGFQAGARSRLITFDINEPVRRMRDVSDFVQEAPENVKVDISEHNVYGWANYYYDHAEEYKQKPEKKKFFDELRNPVGTLANLIVPWRGQETDFKYIMDMLNDPMTQKKLGAFYTPPAYSRKAAELVRQAIDRVPVGNDYVIIDRCAGSGNLEMYLDDGDEDVLSHVIISTYELKEWMVLKDRYNGRVRYIIPPVPKTPDTLPDLNDEGFLSGANALTRDIIDNPEVKKCIDDPHCTIILFENPPYAETTSIEFQKRDEGKDASKWKDSFVIDAMKKEVAGATSNDLANAFIWSGFHYFLRQPTDSYIVFSPIKYWKAQHLIQRKFLNGFAFNRIHFHAKTAACVTCILWSNETDTLLQKFSIHAYDLDKWNRLVDEGTIDIKAIKSIFSEKYYDNRREVTDTYDGIASDLDGTETDYSKKKVRVQRTYNPDIIGYMAIDAAGFDNPRLHACLTRNEKFNGNGFNVRMDNFLEKLPCFAASRYTDNYNNWKVMSMVMKSGDKAEQYEADVKSGRLNQFLCQTLIWTGLTHYAHMRSLDGSDGRYYKNELCFDNLDGKITLAYSKLNEFIANGYQLSDFEHQMFNKWNGILTFIRDNCSEYNPKYSYGLYQIDEEINVKIQQGVKSDGKPNMIRKYGDLQNMITDMKTLVKQYYLDNLVETLLEYEFLK